MRRGVRAVLLAVVAAVLPAIRAAGCGGFPAEEERAAVSVGGSDFTRADLDGFLRSRTALGGALDAPLLSALLDEFVREKLLLVAAREAGVEVSEMQLLAELGALRARPGAEAAQARYLDLDGEFDGEFDGASDPASDRDGLVPPGGADGVVRAPDDGESLRARVADRLLVERFLETVVLDGLDVPEEALRQEFEAERAFYARPETVTLSERRFASREEAEQAAAGDGGSGRPQAASSGEAGDEADPFVPIGTFRRGELPDAVDQAVFGLEPGETSEAMETPAGFRVFRVERRLPAAPLEFEEVRDVVRLTVLRREADARVEALLAELRERHPVTVHPDSLSFPYVGLLPKAE